MMFSLDGFSPFIMPPSQSIALLQQRTYLDVQTNKELSIFRSSRLRMRRARSFLPGTIAQPASKSPWKRDGKTVGRGDEYQSYSESPGWE